MARRLDSESEKMTKLDGKFLIFFTFGTSDNIKREVKSNEFCCEDAGMAVDV